MDAIEQRMGPTPPWQRPNDHPTCHSDTLGGFLVPPPRRRPPNVSYWHVGWVPSPTPSITTTAATQRVEFRHVGWLSCPSTPNETFCHVGGFRHLWPCCHFNTLTMGPSNFFFLFVITLLLLVVYLVVIVTVSYCYNNNNKCKKKKKKRTVKCCHIRSRMWPVSRSSTCRARLRNPIINPLTKLTPLLSKTFIMSSRTPHLLKYDSNLNML